MQVNVSVCVCLCLEDAGECKCVCVSLCPGSLLTRLTHCSSHLHLDSPAVRWIVELKEATSAGWLAKSWQGLHVL